MSAVEGMKVVEIEKCRNDIKKLREEMASRNNRCVMFLRLLCELKLGANGAAGTSPLLSLCFQ